MKLELKNPFRDKWRKGYLRKNNNGRRVVDLYNSCSDRTTISYARYLMSVKLGCLINNDIQVDHIDEDKTNDKISNLQLLSSTENLAKTHEHYRNNIQVKHTVSCDYCRVNFVITERELKRKLAKQTGHMFCGRSCAGSYHTKISLRSNTSK